MTDLLTSPLPVLAAAHPAPGPPARMRPRWRVASTAVSWLLVACATVGGVHLGLAAPAVSPVSPPAVTAAVADAPAPVVAGAGAGRGARGPGGRRG